MSNQKASLSKLLAHVTKPWKSEMHKADRHDRLRSYARFYVSSNRRTIRDAVFSHLETAYNKASSNGKYWANARQIFYAIRPMIQNEVDADDLKAAYITGVLLKDYIEQDCGGSRAWKIAWDARGHFEEPHTGKKIGVGGIDVMEYIASWGYSFDGDDLGMDERVTTNGPINRFHSVLFIEKEGFDEILGEAKIAENHDMAIMSTKGIPVKAACDLLCSLESHVRIFVLHDFDKSGFTILKTLRQGTRLARGCDVIDLGLRFEDVKDLESEDIGESGNGYQARRHLESCGATKEEIEFLIPSASSTYRGWDGKRVELNAMTSEQFVEWLEGKLEKYQIEKVVPEEEELMIAYRRAVLGQKIEGFIEEQKKEVENYKVPSDLKSRVESYLEKNPAESWDSVVWDIAEENKEET
jgi:5S rRNA maturation endonuclease (ribonuclease M5)